MALLDSIAVEFDLTDRSHRVIALDELHIDPNDKNRIYWIHSNLSQKQIFKKLALTLHLPDDVVSLCLQDDPMPKLIDHDEVLTINIQYLLSTDLNHHEEVEFANMILHLTDQFCFTATAESPEVLHEFMRAYPKALRYAKTPCFVLFLVLDSIVNDYAKILFNFDVLTDQMDFSTRSMQGDHYQRVMTVKQQVLKVKRYATAMREILMRVSGRSITVISDQCRAFLYNLSNHSHMLINEAESTRDMLNSMLDQIDNALMQKMNEIMKVLTSFAAILLPLTLIAGIYGMNFRDIPELQWKYGYWYALSLMIVVAGILFYFFKRKKWF